MASLIVISWRDIPAQVIVKRGRETRAAMRAGKGSSDAYLADWQRSAPRPCGEDLQAEASAEAARLEAKFTDQDLERLIRAKGVDGTAGAASTAVDLGTTADSGTAAASPDESV
jgi:hypothetical protein